MAEKKVFAQIDVLGSNQTPMDAFIYMEDQGGGSENPVRLEPHITIQESGAYVDADFLNAMISDFKNGNSKVYVINSMYISIEDSFDVLFIPTGYNEHSKILKFETCFDRNVTMYASIDENGLITFNLQTAVISDFWTGPAPDEAPTLNALELNDHLYKIGGGATLEDIVDADGNKRFISGDINAYTNAFTQSGQCTYTYKKYALSGNHLMIVLAGVVPSGGTYKSSGVLFEGLNLPAYITDKIFTYSSSSTVILRQKLNFTDGNANNLENGDFTAVLSKAANGSLYSTITNLNTQIFRFADNYFRVQFDLIID